MMDLDYGQEFELMEVLRMAIEEEQKIQRLYEYAAELSQDPILRIMLGTFIQEGKRHERRVRERFNLMSSTVDKEEMVNTIT